MMWVLKQNRSFSHSISLLVRKSKKVSLLALVILTLTQLSVAKETAPSKDSSKASGLASDYGTLYMIENRATPTKSWQASANMNYEFSNPYLNVYGASIGIDKTLNRFFAIGVLGNLYTSSLSSETKTLEKELDAKGISQKIQRPRSSIYLTGTVIPLGGHINLFNFQSQPFDIAMTVGVGSTQFIDRSSEMSVLWMVGPRVYLSSTWGLSLNIGQEIDSPFTDEAHFRTKGKLGIVMQW